MTDYWRPGYSEEYKNKLQEFLDNHPEVPIDNPREFMKFCTDQTIMDVVTKSEKLEEQRQEIEEEIKDKLESL
jgi:hypothetical protein